MTMTIRRAGPDDLDVVAPLFDRYRHFYTKQHDSLRSRDFIAQRLQRNESVVLLALLGAAPTGFAQLYPMFSSVRAARVWVLNDLFVEEGARRNGVAQALLDAATAFARADGAIRLELETDHGNASAQALYRASGWQAYDGTLRFHLPLISG